MDSLVFVTGGTDLGDINIVMQVEDIPTVHNCGLFRNIHIEYEKTIEAKCNQGVTKKDLDDNPNIIFYSIPKYIINRNK